MSGWYGELYNRNAMLDEDPDAVPKALREPPRYDVAALMDRLIAEHLARKGTNGTQDR